MEQPVHDPQQYLAERDLEWEIFQYSYQFSLRDKIYVSKITNSALKDLCIDSAIEESKAVNSKLAGEIQKEYRVLSDFVIQEVSEELKIHLSRILGREVQNVSLYNPSSDGLYLWVNFQKANEYNPAHHHSGLFSFVIYASIPEPIREEYKNAIGNDRTRGLIQFSSEISNDRMTFNPSDDTILIFESSHVHQVYPFYSDNTRITIAGNVYGWD